MTGMSPSLSLFPDTDAGYGLAAAFWQDSGRSLNREVFGKLSRQVDKLLFLTDNMSVGELTQKYGLKVEDRDFSPGFSSYIFFSALIYREKRIELYRPALEALDAYIQAVSFSGSCCARQAALLHEIAHYLDLFYFPGSGRGAMEAETLAWMFAGEYGAMEAGFWRFLTSYRGNSARDGLFEG